MDYFFSFYSTPPSIKINLNSSPHRNIKFPTNKGELIEYPTYYPSDSITGKIEINLNRNKALSHSGIKLNLIGILENKKDSSKSYKLIESFRNISPANIINNEINVYDFNIKFDNESNIFDSYYGHSFALRYFLIATVLWNNSQKNNTNKIEIMLVKPMPNKEFNSLINSPLRMEIGIEDLIHIIFEIEKSNYFLRDTIIGKINFKMINIHIVEMEIQIVRKETLINNEEENEMIVLSRHQIMDGCPEEEYILPFRLFLNGIRSLTPSYENIDNKYKVEYFLHLEFLDNKERRFFKRLQIKLFRLINMNRN